MNYAANLKKNSIRRRYFLKKSYKMLYYNHSMLV
jgi:hypothetical protein